MKIIGVDLGTTNSCVYYLNEKGDPVLALGPKRSKIFPSVVWSARPGAEVVVGHEAKARMGYTPPPIVAVKRLMGTTETVALGGEQVTPVQVSSHMLAYTRKLVEELTEDQVGGVVITIPAYFDSPAKQATRQAAVDAFFDGDPEKAHGRLELLLEPEAAAYAYLMEDPNKRLRILVYDLGGGTFDVTVLEKTPDSGLIMLKFGGDPHLGGDNFDDRVATWILYRLRGGKPDVLDRLLDEERYDSEQRYTILQQVLTNDTVQFRGVLRREDHDLLIEHDPWYTLDLDPANPEDRVRAQKLKLLAEKAKKDLTIATNAVIAHQGAFEDQEGTIVDIDFSLSRADFNQLVQDLVETTLDTTLRTLQEGGITPDQIDQVLLVGGSSRMPVVKERLEHLFACSVKVHDPDLIVARGAVLRARDLNPPPLGGDSTSRLSLQYPHQTPDSTVTIVGLLDQPLTGYHAYISRDNRDLVDAAVDGDRFHVFDVPLLINTTNSLHVEIANQEDELYAEATITILHDENAVKNGGPISTVVTKPIRILGTSGFTTLFDERDKLPAEIHHPCIRATTEDFIRIPFYEGERWLEDLYMPGVDPALPIGSVIDLHIVFGKDYTLNATATVHTTQQSQSIEFKISHLDLPSMEAMDEDMEEVLEHVDNDITTVRDPNLRAGFARRVRRLEGNYRKSRRALEPDLHGLYAIIGELKKVLVEIRGAQDFLEPPIEVFERHVGIVQRLANNLDETSPIPRQDAIEKVLALERAGKKAWDDEDVPMWRKINEDLVQFSKDLTPRSGGGVSDMPPTAIQSQMLEWIKELRQTVKEHALGAHYDSSLDQVESTTRNVDLRNEGDARNALLNILEDELKPLAFKVDQASKSLQESPAKGGHGTKGNIE